MQTRIMYIELKTGYSDNGPDWIGRVAFSKSGKTIYFNNKRFIRYKGIFSNYRDIETGENYWISGVKKNGEDRHWAGKGKIIIDKKIIDEYIQITGAKSIDSNRLDIVEIADIFPVERISKYENGGNL